MTTNAPFTEPAQPASGRARGLVAVGAVLLTLGSIAWAADLYRSVLGLLLYNEQFLAGMLALALALVYLHAPAQRQGARARVPWYDWIGAGLSLAAGIYMVAGFPVLSEEVVSRPLDGLVVAWLIVPLVVEGLRRTAGNVLTIVVLCFLAYALVGDLVPGDLAGRPVKLDQLLYYLAWDPGSMLGTPMVVATTIVIAFIFFGQLLFASGGSAFFTDISLALMGRFRGGSAKIAVTASGLFGSISGSAVSNVVSTGVITIPLMRQGGYEPHVAGAIEAVASTGGQLMPPVMGAAAFLMAEFLQVPYTEVVLAALIPAVLYYVALFVQTDLLAARNGITRVEESRIPRIGRVLLQGWHYPIPFAVLIGALFSLNWSPQLSALVGALVLCVSGMAVGYGGQRLTPRGVLEALRDTGTSSLDILMITAAAGFIIGVLNISGLGFSLSIVLVNVGGENVWILLLLSAAVCIVLGMGMPTVGVYVLLAALVAPSLVKVGVEPMAAHLFVLYFGMMSMITPPVAIAAFAAASLADTDAMKTGWAAMRFGWLAYVIPFVFVLSPRLLMKGDPLSVAVAFATAVAGVWITSAAVVGYLTRPLGIGMRVLFAIAGIMLFLPADSIPYGVEVEVAGALLAMLLVGREMLAGRRLKQA
ncbi:MAG: TRAP transporter fused permease subunit [Alphaproteobacteria bacterium]|nr:TRAP transporter fused permease subunit [Alphaproteobacteria bacterium]